MDRAGHLRNDLQARHLGEHDQGTVDELSMSEISCREVAQSTEICSGGGCNKPSSWPTIMIVTLPQVGRNRASLCAEVGLVSLGLPLLVRLFLFRSLGSLYRVLSAARAHLYLTAPYHPRHHYSSGPTHPPSLSLRISRACSVAPAWQPAHRRTSRHLLQLAPRRKLYCPTFPTSDLSNSPPGGPPFARLN